MKKLHVHEVQVKYSYRDESGDQLARWSLEVSEPKKLIDEIENFVQSKNKGVISRSENIQAI